MLSKESKMRVMENFYSLDHIFFGKSVSKVKSCCPALVEDYLASKGALMSVVIEMFKLVDHKPEVIEEKVEVRDVVKQVRHNTKIARENSERLVLSKQGKEDVTEIVSSILEEHEVEDVDGLVIDTIREKAFNLAVDNLLIARTLHESDNIEALDDFEGKLLEDAYKTLRSDIVESALVIIDSVEASE